MTGTGPRSSPVRTIADIGEEALIQIFASRALPADDDVWVANGDDAAVFGVQPGQGVVISTDTLVEGLHFDFAYTTPEDVGRKIVGVNVSDLAGMGAEPKYAFLSVALPGQASVTVIEEIASGLAAHAEELGLILLGGNVTRTTGPMVFTLTVTGAQTREQVARRLGARPGDVILVTGTLGDARAGLWVAQHADAIRDDDEDVRAYLLDRLTNPKPRPLAGRAMVETGRVRAMADISDGLGRDLRRMLQPGGLGARIEASRVPVSHALSALAEGHQLDPVELALSGGEDYELLVLVAPEHEPAVRAASEGSGVPSTRIGVVTEDPEFSVEMADGALRALPAGFVHFA